MLESGFCNNLGIILLLPNRLLHDFLLLALLMLLQKTNATNYPTTTFFLRPILATFGVKYFLTRPALEGPP
jgi:hypothetical protein